MSDRTCELPRCKGKHRAHGLCAAHDARSRRAWVRAGRPEDWDWKAGAGGSGSKRPSRGQRPADAAQNFTGGARDRPGGVRGAPPPAGTPREPRAESPDPPVRLNLREAVEQALQTLPPAAQTGWRAAAVRLLAETLEEARWGEGTQPSASGIRELWARMTALEEAHAEQERDAIDELGAVLLRQLSATEDP